MALDLTKVKSVYFVERKELKLEEYIHGLLHEEIEVVSGSCNILQAVDFISQYVTDGVEMIHFTEQKVEKGTGMPGPFRYDNVTFVVRFLGENWSGLGIQSIKITTDLKYGYSFLVSALREKFTNIAICAKNLNK